MFADVFTWLMERRLIVQEDILYTNDGFSLVTQSLFHVDFSGH